tara:strand:- start:356 stop:745 length:390 start_codon:yes stop_codon:yes gene_type:complete
MDLRSKDAIESSKQHDIQMGNILIAEFMGLINHHNDSSVMLRKVSHNNEPLINEVVPLKALQYDTSWDWLMPIVEKIESLRDENGNAYRFTIDMGNAQIEGTNIEIVGGSCKLDTTYQAVVEFIKNQNN